MDVPQDLLWAHCKSNDAKAESFGTSHSRFRVQLGNQVWEFLSSRWLPTQYKSICFQGPASQTNILVYRRHKGKLFVVRPLHSGLLYTRLIRYRWLLGYQVLVTFLYKSIIIGNPNKSGFKVVENSLLLELELLVCWDLKEILHFLHKTSSERLSESISHWL